MGEFVGMQDWGTALIWFLITVGVLKGFEQYVLRWLKEWSEKTETDFDDAVIEALESVGWPLYITLGLFAGSRFLELSEQVRGVIANLVIVVAIYYVVRGLQKIVDFILKRLMSGKEAKRNGFDDPMMARTLGMGIKGLLWLLAILMVLQNMGVEVTALIGGLGIGGLAIAFALQNVLADLFAYFTIYFDKPFRIGDFIVLGTDMGTVEKIGIKSTRLRTLQGELLIVSNKELTETRVGNFKKLRKRRVVFGLGVTYDTPLKKMKEIPKVVKKLVNKHKLAELDRVHFKEFGDFSLNFEVVYFVDSDDYTKFMDIQQAINLEIMEVFEKEKIEMAYPTQTVYVEKRK